MHVPINVKSPNYISKWQMGINSAFKGLIPAHVRISTRNLHLFILVTVAAVSYFPLAAMHVLPSGRVAAN
jgi:hypothetical protein